MTRILGPGIVPAPSVPIATEMADLTHAVILHDGEPVWVLDHAFNYDQRPGEYRPACWQIIRPGEPIALDCGCSAAGACKRHNSKDALKWWTEATRRDNVREWRPELRPREVLHHDAERPVCVTREHAEREARRLRRPCVVLRDGWYRELERHSIERETP